MYLLGKQTKNYSTYNFCQRCLKRAMRAFLIFFQYRNCQGSGTVDRVGSSTPEDQSSNPVIANLYLSIYSYSYLGKENMKKKEKRL